MSGLTIANGSTGGGSFADGGGIDNEGNLTLSNCNLYGNNASPGGRGGAIWTSLGSGNALVISNCNIGGTAPGQANSGGAAVQGAGTLTMTGGSIVGNQGGGLNFTGRMSLTGVAISDNSSLLDGGGVLFNATTSDPNSIVNCLVANNTAAGNGGGILAALSSNFMMINTTVSGNRAAGGGGGVRILGKIVNSTITNNRSDSNNNGAEPGGGIDGGAGATLNNTIIAGNFRGGSGSVADDISGNVPASSAFNLIGTGGSGGLTNGVNHNQVGVANPLLGSLASNGGGTLTHALLVGSPAINAGSNALAVDPNGGALATDQRGAGFPRVFNGTVDIGAYEAGNPIDEATFFVKQQYLDFLNRQPDQSGWDFWTNEITSCGANVPCTEVKRINVSAAFFLSIEFQQTGNLVYKMYKAGFGNLSGKPVAVDRAPFLTDTRQIQSTPAQVIVGQGNWQAQLETNKQAFALAFVQRSAFQTTHAAQTADEYVNSLFTNTGASPTAAETSAAVTAFNAAGGGDAGRAAGLRSVAESASVAAKLNNEAFVLMQYFGYLQRNPYDPPESTLDYSGYNFWLAKLNQFNGDFIAAEMVKAFISSSEYRQRFGP
jgi:hypothetical protein